MSQKKARFDLSTRQTSQPRQPRARQLQLQTDDPAIAEGNRRLRAHTTAVLRWSSAGAVRRSRVQRASQGSVRLRNPGDQSDVAERDK